MKILFGARTGSELSRFIYLIVELGHRIALEASLRGVFDLVIDVQDVLVHVLLGSKHDRANFFLFSQCAPF